MQTQRRRSTAEVAALVLVAGTAVVFLLLASGRITARFGDSDEGINGAVWSYDARSLRDLGVIDSRLGGKRLDGSLYATHPPLIVIETAATQTAGGDHPWSSRAPAWIGSLVALMLLYRLARAAGFEPLVAGGATALTGLTPMLVVYGPMLDTPVTSLPFGLAVALCWIRDWRGDRPVPMWLAGLVALVAALSGWQAAVLTGMCGLSLAAKAVRHRPGALRAAAPYLVGGAVGALLSLGWAWWVYGSFHVLDQKFLGRSGSSSGVGLGDMISFQVPWLFELLGLSMIGLVGCAVALRDRALRPLAAMSLASVFVYAVIFRQAAAGHQYWNYWALFPAAIGWAYVLDRLVRDMRRSGSGARWAVAAVVVLVVAVGGYDLVRPNKAGTLIDRGHRAPQLVADARFPSGQTELHYLGQPYRPDAWITYNTHLSPVPLTTRAQLDALASSRPNDLVLVLGDCDTTDPSYRFCAAATRPNPSSPLPQPPRLVPAQELVRSG